MLTERMKMCPPKAVEAVVLLLHVVAAGVELVAEAELVDSSSVT